MMHTANRNPLPHTLSACMLAWLVAAFLPAAEPAGCDAEADHRSCRAQLLRQLAADTAVEAARHPLRTGRLVVGDAVDFFGNAVRGTFAKRLGLGSLCPCGPAATCPFAPRTGLETAHLALYTEGPEALAALEQVIDSAACRLDVLMFDWADDALGRKVAARLAAWAGPGRRLRVLVDGGGNLLFPGAPTESVAQANGAVCWLAHQPFVEVRRTRDPCGHFDHRKLVLADGALAWTGGRNFTEPAFGRRDLVFTLAGPPAVELAARFETFWREQGGRPACPLPPAPPVEANAAARLVWTEPPDREIRNVVYRIVDGAVARVWLENPYLADAGLVARLARARRRGADVRVVLTLHTDTDVSRRSNRVTANRLLAAGVRVYLYPCPMHTKAATADGCWGYIGTGNFDTLSLRRNREIGVVLGPGPVLTELEERLFLADLQPEYELCVPLPLSPADRTAEALAALAL
jgi:phosphatidylserine/phosphatidylglycerophosphate/cardiolipin synthase-like enzyme